MKLLKAPLGCIVGSTLLFAACGVEPASMCDALLTCNEFSADGVAPPDCDLTKGLKDSPSCIDESVAVFVSPSGDDGASGTGRAAVLLARGRVTGDRAVRAVRVAAAGREQAATPLRSRSSAPSPASRAGR